MIRRPPPDAAPTPGPAQPVTRQQGDVTAKVAPAAPVAPVAPPGPAAAPAAPAPPRPAVKRPLQHGPARRKRW